MSIFYTTATTFTDIINVFKLMRIFVIEKHTSQIMINL